MMAHTPPMRCASAMTCCTIVVLPDASGPKISVTRPRGMPPTPRAMSNAIEPVGMISTAALLGFAQLHDRALAELLFDLRDGVFDCFGLIGLSHGLALSPLPGLVRPGFVSCVDRSTYVPGAS